MSYKESVLIPKSSFITISKKPNDSEKKSRKRKASPPPKLKKVKKRKPLSNTMTEARKSRANKRKATINTLKKRSRLNKLSKERSERLLARAIKPNEGLVSASTTIAEDRKSLYRFFPRQDHHIIHRVMDILSKYSDRITWDNKSYEVTFSGKFYPETSLIDMLNYLLDNGSSFRTEEGESHIPKEIEKLLAIFKDYFDIKTLKVLPNYIPFDATRVNKVVEYRILKNSQTFRKTVGKSVKRNRLSLGASPALAQPDFDDDDDDNEITFKKDDMRRWIRNKIQDPTDSPILPRSDPIKRTKLISRFAATPERTPPTFTTSTARRTDTPWSAPTPVSNDYFNDNDLTVRQQLDEEEPPPRRKLRERKKIKPAKKYSPHDYVKKNK